MLKKQFILLITIIMMSVIFFNFTVYATDNICVTYNGVPIKFDTPPTMRNGRVLVPLRAIGEALGVPIEWLQETQSIFYFNNNGTGYSLYINNPKVEVNKGAGIPTEYITIDVSPTIINGRTYVPVRFIAESFNIDVKWDDKTQTVIIKDKSAVDKNASIQVEHNNKIYTIYAVPGTGKYTGWLQLKGYPDDNLLNVFFRYEKENGISTTEYKPEYIGKYDLSKSVTWVDQSGLVHINTIDELFSIQTSIGGATIEKMREIYGDMYNEWEKAYSIEYGSYVNNYLIAAGIAEDLTKPYIYLSDKNVVLKLGNNKANVNYYDKNYEIYSIPADEGWRQLKGFYGENYFDLFFYIKGDNQDNISDIRYKIVLKDTYDFNKDISWVDLNYNTCKSKLDVYNAINYYLNTYSSTILEYYTVDSKKIKPLDIVSENDKILYEAFHYLHNEEYKYFAEEYLKQLGLKINLSVENKTNLRLEDLISRKLSADEILMLIDNFILLSAQEISDFLESNPNSINFKAHIDKILIEGANIRAMEKLKNEDYEQYKLESQYMSEDSLDKNYGVSFYFIPEVDDTTSMKAKIIYYVDGKRQDYDLGNIPVKPQPSKPYNANGIKILFKDNKAYLNKDDLKAKGIPLIRK